MHTYKISEGTCEKTTEFSSSLIFKGENTGWLLLLINSLDEDLIICLFTNIIYSIFKEKASFGV